MEIDNAIDTLDDVLKLKCHKAIAVMQRTLDLYGCTECSAHNSPAQSLSTLVLDCVDSRFSAAA